MILCQTVIRLHFLRMCDRRETLWYFAYGSNMLLSKFTGSRGIVPISSARVRIPGWKLTMEIPGLPYSEPSFGSIVSERIVDVEKSLCPDVLGVAYLITEDQYRQVVASEGGGIAYTNIRVNGEPMDDESEAITGPRVVLRTLGSALSRQPAPSPSKRYMVRARLTCLRMLWSSDGFCPSPDQIPERITRRRHGNQTTHGLSAIPRRLAILRAPTIDVD